MRRRFRSPAIPLIVGFTVNSGNDRFVLNLHDAPDRETALVRLEVPLG
jgi:hypothetical protein